ncbi:MAG: LysE family transporter [Saprospiraceae bacterium]|nr:LysE family transporter [Saprospiraceae bacterium]
MSHLWNGIQLGLALALITGPILFALIQAGVERGFRAGLALGSGIWISDLLFILAVFWSGTFLDRVVANVSLLWWLGIIGSIILVGIGIGTLFSKPPPLSYTTEIEVTRSPYHLLWLKGFAINTFNPFTFFFWISVMTSVVLANKLSTADASLFFTGILATIILTDLLKVILAKRIRQFLQWKHLLILRRIAGLALIAFGVVLLVRVLWQFG